METERKKKEDEILKRLEEVNKSKPFVIDGMINPEVYENEPQKIVFLLKETNSDSAFDLRAFLRKGGRARTWNNVARWVKGILSDKNELDWANEFTWANKATAEHNRKEYLNKICVVNIKKSPGGAVANGDKLKDTTNNYKALLKEQIDIYTPDILICGGTAQYYNGIYDIKNKNWEHTSRGIPYIASDERIVIDYAHPDARISPYILLYAIVDATREIKPANKI